MLLAAWYHFPLALVFLVLAILLMAVILLQRGRGVGLSGAFGGAGLHTAFGSKTGDVLTWATIVLAGVFLVYSVLMNYAFVPQRVSTQNRAAVPALPAGVGTDAPQTGGAGSTAPGTSNADGAAVPPATPPAAGGAAPAGAEGAKPAGQDAAAPASEAPPEGRAPAPPEQAPPTTQP